ncbi:MAG: hypothetical protein GDA36_09510 [Rhodobacteraceae bacterium]|nr:hypothetical protein [Paracoccaceae bacterium]
MNRIDAPADWRWCSPTCKPALGCSGIGPQGYDPLVRCKCLLIGEWHPEAGAALNCSWISCCVAAPASLRLCPMRRPITGFVTHDDLLAEVCRTPQDRAEEVPSDDPDMDFSTDTQTRWVNKGPKSTPGYKMTSRRLCVSGQGPDEESFIDKVHKGHQRTGPKVPGLIP